MEFLYQINARTELAIRYNDISPLENHHCAVAFQILSQPECNIFSSVPAEGFKQIRQVCGVRAPHRRVGGTGGTVSPTREQKPSRPVPEAPTSPSPPPGILGGRPSSPASSKAKRHPGKRSAFGTHARCSRDLQVTATIYKLKRSPP